MPLSNLLRRLLCFPGPIEEAAEAPTRPLLPEPAPAVPAPAGRPYRDYVENETDRYWREMVKPGSLPKPGRQELRAGAFHVQGKAMRRRQCKTPDPALAPYRAHQGVNAVHKYLVDKGLIKPAYSRIETSPGYLEALFQLQADARWQPRQIPLPAHPDPQHPAIYYYINDPVRERPVPREDALIYGDYLYTGSGHRLTCEDRIPPWPGPGPTPSAGELIARGWHMCYSLERTEDTVWVMLHWVIGPYNCPLIMMELPLGDLHFSPH